MTPKDPFLEGTFWNKFWRPIRSRAPLFTPDFSFLDFCSRFVFFTYGGGTVSREDQSQFPGAGNREQKRPNPMYGRGGNMSRKDQTDFPP